MFCHFYKNISRLWHFACNICLIIFRWYFGQKNMRFIQKIIIWSPGYDLHIPIKLSTYIYIQTVCLGSMAEYILRMLIAIILNGAFSWSVSWGRDGSEPLVCLHNYKPRTKNEADEDYCDMTNLRFVTQT